MKKEITVYLADDHTLFRKGMRRLLESFESIACLEEAENGKKLIDLMEIKVPDVVLLDIRMPVMDGMDTCTFINRNYPQVKIIILSMEENKKMIIEMIKKGAHGYLSKASNPEEVESAIIAVLENSVYNNELVTEELRSQIINNKLAPRSNDPFLTKREIEILRLTSEQMTMREIAEKLSISERTVHNHRMNMMRKLGVKNVSGLMHYALVQYQT